MRRSPAPPSSLIEDVKRTMKRHHIVLALLSAGFGIAACGGKPAASDKGAAAPAASGAPAAPPTGKIVTVEMISDAVGNYFKPADFEVHRGDVIRDRKSTRLNSSHAHISYAVFC